MKRYHFSLGNSTKGPVGYCAVVVAESRKQAVEKLRERLPEEHLLDGSAEYLAVYFNADRVSEKDIDEEEDAS